MFIPCTLVVIIDASISEWLMVQFEFPLPQGVNYLSKEEWLMMHTDIQHLWAIMQPSSLL
jgi:hypothetical protein